VWWRASPSRATPRSAAAATAASSAAGVGEPDDDVRTRRVAAHRHPGGRHRRHHGLPPLRQLAPQPAQVPAQVAVRGERREHPLARPRRPDAGSVALRHHDGAHGRGRHEPAHAQRRRQQLARGAQVHDDVRAQRGEQRERGDVVAQLAVVVVLDDQEPLGPARATSATRRAADSRRAERELVRRRAVDGREAGRQGVDDQPSPSTGTGSTASPAPRSAAAARW
jgi:hypothetical protein